MPDMIRINTRISKDLNDWLEEQTEQNGVPKSTMIYLALENFRKEKQVMAGMANMSMVIQKLEQLENKIEDAAQKS